MCVPATKPRAESMAEGRMLQFFLCSAAVFTGACLLGWRDRLFVTFACECSLS